MKILSAKQVRETDAYTIQHEPIASIDLMERASVAFVNWFSKVFDSTKSVAVVCGTGNNGGDGLAVSRILIELGYQVSTFVTGTSGTDDFQINYDLLMRKIPIVDLTNEEVEFNQDILIDALFGSGLSRSPEGIFGQVINKINHSNGITISIDIASGLYSDEASLHDNIVRPDYTISFQFPKLSMMLAENADYTGSIEIVDIGLDKEFIKREITSHHYVTAEFLRHLIQPRSRHAHKGNFGRGGLVVGSYGKMGAAVLASRAYMRAGAGLLTVFCPKSGNQILQTSVPEAMTVSVGEDQISGEVPIPSDFDAIGVGPGIGTSDETGKTLGMLLKSAESPVVLDADALNLISKNRELMGLIPDHSILTPHPKEFERLFGSSSSDFLTLTQLSAASKRLNSYIVLKGAYTATSNPEGSIYFNSTGNPGMATGGSGDVLTGIITSLLAQGQTPFHSAILGVYLHGLAGDLSKSHLGEIGVIASDLITYLPDAFQRLSKEK